MSIVLFENKDKKYNEHWTPDRDFANFPNPSRILICSKPNCGKSTTVLNLILRQDPIYKKIYLIHPDLKRTFDDDDHEPDEDEMKVKEYSSIDFVPLFGIPDPVFFKPVDKKDAMTKKLLIIDDVELKTLSKNEKKRLNKVLSFSSSHYNMSVVITSQDIFSQLNVAVVRFCNVFIVYPYSDINYNRMMLNRFGIGKKLQDKILDEMKTYGVHDSLCIDRTDNSPAPFRKNLYIPLPHLSFR